MAKSVKLKDIHLGCDVARVASLLTLVKSDDVDIPALQGLLDQQPINACDLVELVTALRIADASSRQRELAEKRHRERKNAMQHVRDLWPDQAPRNGAKKEFSERMSSVVLNKFGVKVKPTTIARDWLRGCIAPAMRGPGGDGEAIAHMNQR